MFRTLLRRTLYRKKGNLMSLDNPFSTIATLLNGHRVEHFVDAGASDGRVAEKFLHELPQTHAHAFEPNPDYRAALESYAAREPRFHPEFCALSDVAGEIELQFAASRGTTSIFKPNQRLQQYDPAGSQTQKVVKVPVMTLDDWATARGIKDVGLMKFDIQGGELRALRGATRLLRDSTLLIYTEVLFNPLYEGGAIFSEVDQFLRSLGFELYNLYGPKADQRDLLLWANAIFIHTQKLNR